MKKIIYLNLVILLGFFIFGFSSKEIVTPVDNEVRINDISGKVTNSIDSLSQFKNFSTYVKNGKVIFNGKRNLGQTGVVRYSSAVDPYYLASCEIEYDYSLDLNQRDVEIVTTFHFLDGSYELETIYGTVAINGKGELDIRIFIDELEVYLSDLESYSRVNETGWLVNLLKAVVSPIVNAVVSVPVAVANVITGAVAVFAGDWATVGTSLLTQVADRIQSYLGPLYKAPMEAASRFNLNNNLKFADPNGYVNKQVDYTDWKYGFSNLEDTGCTVIAIYNLLRAKEIKVKLAEVIYVCEMMENEILFGLLGGNPASLYRVLSFYYLTYYNSVSLEKLQFVADKYENSFIILTYSNEQNLSRGAHTIFIKKTGDQYHSYNNGSNDGYKISEFIGSGYYIYGYVIY